jgi:hypothetical protein
MGSIELEILEEVIQGLKEYFNKSLGRLLLYRFERQQFFDIHSRVESPTSDLAGKPFCDIYGGEHLLRLFGLSTLLLLACKCPFTDPRQSPCQNSLHRPTWTPKRSPV